MEQYDEEESEQASLPPTKKKRVVRPKMRRAFDDLDPAVYATKRRRRHRRQHFVRAIRKLVGRCSYCGRPANGETTCETCLKKDRAYKASQHVPKTGAKYRDENGRLFRLRTETRMVPLPGRRHDGYDLPDCENRLACEVELMRALGPKEAAGMSCPQPCPHFTPAAKPQVTKRPLGR